MRFVYVDEAGISNKSHEPVTVVAGIIVNADRQLVELEAALDNLVERHIPLEKREGFVFHAMELFNGGGKVFRKDSDEWPLERRLRLADELGAIVGRFGLPVPVGYLKRDDIPEDALVANANRALSAHAVAFAVCGMRIESWMRANAPEEVCMLIVEDNESARTMMRDVQRNHQGMTIFDALTEEEKRITPLPLRSIKHDPLFQPKRPSSVLQLADFCAYIVKKVVMGDPRYNRFVYPLQKLILDGPA